MGPALATDLLGADAGQLVRHDRRRARLHHLRPVRKGEDRSDQLLEAGASTPICTFLPRAAYAGGDIPKWTPYGIAQTLVNLPGPQSKLYLKKGIQYGATVNDLLWVFAEGAWEQLLATVKIMNAMPYARISPATVTAVQDLPRAARAGAAEIACGKVSPGAGGLRQPDPVLQLHGSRRVEGGHGLAEAARGEVGPRDRSVGPLGRRRPTGRWETETGCATSCSSRRWALGAGALIASIALGVVLIYRGSGVINVATGAIAMVAAYIFWALRTDYFGFQLSTAPAFVLTLACMAAFGVLIELAIFRPLRNTAPLAKLAASLGLLLVLESGMIVIFGNSLKSAPSVLPTDTVRDLRPRRAGRPLSSSPGS